MSHLPEFVTRKEWEDRLNKTDPVIERFVSVEEEVMGNETTRRPGLREDFSQQLGGLRKDIRKLGWTIIAALIVSIVASVWTDLHTATKATLQTNQEAPHK